MFNWQNPNFTWTMLSDIKGISNDHILLLSKRLFQRSLNHRMDVVLGSTGQQMAQPHFLQLVLLRGTDVEERCYNVSECSKECDSQMRRQNRVEKRDPHSSTSHPNTLEKKNFWAVFKVTSINQARKFILVVNTLLCFLLSLSDSLIPCVKNTASFLLKKFLICLIPTKCCCCVFLPKPVDGPIEAGHNEDK